LTEFASDKSLFCIFHNRHKYETNEGEPCSHIFSGIVQEEGGYLDVATQDFDGRVRSIDTDSTSKQFNLAAIVAIPRHTADALQQMVGKLNCLDEAKQWPFYFSRDMNLLNKYETKGVAAIAPEGHIDPPLNMQGVENYDGDGQRLLARINCVRMAFMNAQMAGVKIANIANINPLSNTGEEVQDRIRNAYEQMVLLQSGKENCLFSENFTAKKKGNDKSAARFALSTEGLCIVQTEKKAFRMTDFCDALARRINGKSIFNWVSEGHLEKFVQTPLHVPQYLQQALSLE
jgi:hypothetical protein